MASFTVPAISLAASATDAGVSIPLNYDNINELSIHAEYGDVTGTWKVEVSNDPRAFPGHPNYASADWEDATTAFGLTNPAGAAGDFNESFEGVNYGFIRLSYTHSAGTEHVRVYITCKE